MKKIIFKTIKNSNIEILYETNRIYTIKDIKKVIENQYGWDHKKLKIYKDKYDINSLLNDDEPLDQYLRNNNKNNNYYYLKNYKYIPISIYEEKKIDDSMNDFDFDSFCSNKELHKNINNFFKEKSKIINSENPDSNRKSVNFSNKNNIFGDNNINNKNSNVNKSNIPKPNNNDDNSNSKNKNNIKDNKPNINNTNTENNNKNKKNESKNETNNNQKNFQKQNSDTKSQSEKHQKKNNRRQANEEIFTEAENQKIEELMNFVGCTREKGIKALKMAKWDLNEASNIIFD